MTPIPCRLLPHEDATGPANMARDEAMLDLVTREPGSAALRTYGWTEPTLSLGYFQKTGQAEADPRWRGVPIVRRPTGGGAIWHHHELTYALAVPRDHPLSFGSSLLYHAAHGAIAALLSGFGIDVRRRAQGRPAGPDGRPFLCFTDQDAEDLVVGDSKVVGSSQRRRAGVILLHGSILLRKSPRTPELSGLADLAPVPSAPAFWAEHFRNRFLDALGFLPGPSGWPDGIHARAQELEMAVYRDAAWTRRR